MDVLARVPAGEQRLRTLLQPLGEDEEGRASRRHQPLVVGADERIEPRGVERQPAAGLGRVDDRQRLVRGGRPEHGVDVRDRSVRRLDGAEGDHVRQFVDRVGELCEGDRDDVEALLVDEERKEQRGEVDLRDDHAGAVRHRRRQHTDERRHGRSRRHPLRRHADEAAEEPARALGRVVPVFPARTAVPPVLERGLKRLPGRSRRQPVARGVQVRPGGLPESLRVGDRE
jgi:hypothetical protein